MKTKSDALAYIATETDSRGKLSQRARILRLVLSAPEIPLPAILDLHIAQYGARIKELRTIGFDIRNRTERIDGVAYSWFRFVDPPPTDARNSSDWFEHATGKPRPAVQPTDLGPLFETVTHG
jgi:hypothetical protein